MIGKQTAPFINQVFKWVRSPRCSRAGPWTTINFLYHSSFVVKSEKKCTLFFSYHFTNFKLKHCREKKPIVTVVFSVFVYFTTLLSSYSQRTGRIRCFFLKETYLLEVLHPKDTRITFDNSCNGTTTNH